MTQTVTSPQGGAMPLKRKGAGLNQLIAKTHKLSGQLLGLQITNGNLIAIFFSAMQITAGIVVFAWISMNGLALLLVPVCAPLALLIERLSLGGLMVFRTAGKSKVQLEDEYHVSHLETEATPKEKYEYDRLLKRLKKDRWMAGGLILLGIGISGYVGDQFWALIFRPVGEPNSTLLSILIAGCVSLTFVFSELYAELSNEGIKDAMRDNQIAKAVLASAEEDLQLELSMEAFGNMRGDPVKRASVVNKIESGLTVRLEAFADRAEYLLSDGGQKQMEDHNLLLAAHSETIEKNHAVLIQEVQELKQIVQAKVEQAEEDQQEDQPEAEQSQQAQVTYADRRETIIEALNDGRDLSVNDVVRLTGKSRATAGRWLARARKEREALLRGEELEAAPNSGELEAVSDEEGQGEDQDEVEIVSGELVEERAQGEQQA